MKKVTVELIIDETKDVRVADAVSSLLTENQQGFTPHDTALVDWQYVGGSYNAVDVAKNDIWDGKPIC